LPACGLVEASPFDRSAVNSRHRVFNASRVAACRRRNDTVARRA
jgi:hypothetical protein